MWKGLTDPAFTSQYWGIDLVTDWKVGSPIVWEHNGVTIADPEQTGARSPTRSGGSSYTWHSFTPELAEARRHRRRSAQAELAAEARSQVAFDIEPVDDVCKLTVVHEFFEPDTIIVDDGQ